ncbi:MAG: transporter substrate-binding domain-containing protein [Chloroflexota bacterium]|nr:transporter substrate-binding domain-containing protein [Chloroflexota bacterium]
MTLTPETRAGEAGHHPLVALWLLLVALLLTACSGGDATVSPTPVPIPTPVPPTPTYLPEGATTGARIRARGYLIVGVRYDLRPFGYVTGGGEVAGFGVDVGRELARRWLGDEQAVQFRQVRSDTAIERLQAGDVDIVVAALTHTKEREAGADFSLPYFSDGQALLVRAADAGGSGGPVSLAGRPVGVVAWEEAQYALWGAVEFTPTLQTYDRFDEAVAAMDRGEVDVVADMRHRLFWGAALLPETVVVGQYTAAPLAIAFPQNDPFFADLVNLTFQEMVSDGAYADLYGRWFAPEAPPAVERWPGDETVSLDDAPFLADAPDTIGAIRARGRLAVALVSGRAPFAYADTTGVSVGYEVSLARLLAGRWLGDSAAVDFTPTTVEEGQEMVRTGQADLLVGGLVHTRAAELTLDFSLTTYVAGEGLLVRAGTPITDITALSGQQAAVVEGSGSREALLAAAQEAGVSLIVLPRPTLEAAIALLEEGQVIAVVGDRVDLLGRTYATPELDVHPLRLTCTPLALGLPPGDSAFRDLVNLTLQALKADGQFDALYVTWFADMPPALEVWPGASYRVLQLDIATAP